MTIRWYPGHMGKAQEKMAEAIRKIDVIIEVLDARLPVIQLQSPAGGDAPQQALHQGPQQE